MKRSKSYILSHRNSKTLKPKRDEESEKVFTGEDKRFIFIIGPCSADNEDAVCDYQNRLAKVAEQVKDKILVIPRIYTNKPRTTGDGYKGMLHQPDPNKASDMLEGLYAIRKMHIRAIKETGLTAADEMLYSENWQYVDDILSYVAIGARSVEDQQHRLTASGMDISSWHEEPNQWGLYCYDEFLSCWTASAYFLIFRMGSPHRRKPTDPLYIKRCIKQTWSFHLKLPLRRSSSFI